MGSNRGSYWSGIEVGNRGGNMGLTTRIFEQGNSYAVVIPKQLCEVLGWQTGTELEVDLVKTNEEQVIILKK